MSLALNIGPQFGEQSYNLSRYIEKFEEYVFVEQYEIRNSAMVKIGQSKVNTTGRQIHIDTHDRNVGNNTQVVTKFKLNTTHLFEEASRTCADQNSASC